MQKKRNKIIFTFSYPLSDKGYSQLSTKIVDKCVNGFVVTLWAQKKAQGNK
ncbi:conserved protein of unknown function [Vibrio tapetis subsp. tapetis]|uniref:Uncharacterized protein n=1 Tax=Vibrio tapetis subsp. tapetis TaxID=1671868 RepID=A0A2N8ZBD3_9VIBR|nr:conserved protein of unknown function [Vibrio tapetis subsp. tapetis]